MKKDKTAKNIDNENKDENPEGKNNKKEEVKDFLKKHGPTILKATAVAAVVIGTAYVAENALSMYYKKHFDEVIDAGTVLSTLSYDKDRTKDADMFYAAHKNSDKHLYNALFNRKAPVELYDDNGNSIGTGEFFKYRIDNVAKKRIKVASEDSGAKKFLQLYLSDKDFYNFVNDKDRMQSHFVKQKYKFKGYREARRVLDSTRDPSHKLTSKDLNTIYRMFNYVIPSDGKGDEQRAKDVATQRAKFFTALKEDGYAAVLDTNDAIYGGFKSKSPVIVFDQSAVSMKDAKRTSANSVKYSKAVILGRKILGK